MNQSIDQMMSEHRLIEQVLGALETFAGQLPQHPETGRAEIQKFARFFSEFADKCHHGKEEDRLFVKMNQCGFPREYGPVAVMLAEHDDGRAHVRALAEIGRKLGALGAAEIDQAMAHAEAFISMLRGHIMKEDNILYPMALQALPPAALQQLDESCEAYDREIMGAAQIQKLKDLALDLAGLYPPDPEKMAAGSACAGCHGHG